MLLGYQSSSDFLRRNARHTPAAVNITAAAAIAIMGSPPVVGGEGGGLNAFLKSATPSLRPVICASSSPASLSVTVMVTVCGVVS